MQSKMRQAVTLCVVAMVLLLPTSTAKAVQLTKHTKAAPKEYYVDGTTGSDNNPGTVSQPFKTLTHARDSIRALKNSSGLPEGGVVVNVRSRDYSFTDGPFSLEEQDSGKEGSPIVYRSYPGDSTAARLSAGVAITVDNTEPVRDGNIFQLLPSHVRDSIVQVDLGKLGITDYGELGSGQLGNCANNKLELYFPGRNMVLARYPDISLEGVWQFLEIAKVVNPDSSFQYSNSRISQWKNTSTLWLHGFWSFDWADNYVHVASINTTSSIFTTDSKTPPVYGFKDKARYYALNILEELDSLDEYYVDRVAGVLYLFKPSSEEKGCLTVGESVVSMNKVSYVQLDGFVVGCSRLTAVTADDVSQVQFTNMVIRGNGDRSISVTGSGNIVRNVTVFDNGCGGLSMSGGDQMSLTRGNNLVTGCEIHHWSRWKRTYQPGIAWSGVGNNYTKNYLHDAPHAAILGGGNDCLFEYNTLSTLCYEVTDSGAFYSGRTWIDRGNVIRHSKFRDIEMTEKTSLGSPSVQAIYLDDQMSGYKIYNNTFINCHVGSFIGGGRRNQVFNNTYLNCSTAVHVDSRGLSWQKDDCSVGGLFEQQLQSVHYQSPPWSTHYPELVNIFKDNPCVPVYNVIANNTYCGGNFIDITMDQAKTWLDTVVNNTQKC